MTRLEFRRIAKRKGFIKWFPSGVIEYVYEIRRGRPSRSHHTFARNIVTGRTHVIIPRRENNCREVRLDEYISIKELLPISHD